MFMNRDGKSKRAVVDKDFLEAELFEAISHPTRIQILKTLRGNTLGFAELKHKLGISSSCNLSHHLNKLAALVEANSQGHYQVTDQGREALYAIVAIARASEIEVQYCSFIHDRLNRYQDLVIR